MAYTITPIADDYAPIAGLEGPFRYRTGRIAYYDPKEGKYWDPRTDFFLTEAETTEMIFGITLKETVYDRLCK